MVGVCVWCVCAFFTFCGKQFTFHLNILLKSKKRELETIKIISINREFCLCIEFDCCIHVSLHRKLHKLIFFWVFPSHMFICVYFDEKERRSAPHRNKPLLYIHSFIFGSSAVLLQRLILYGCKMVDGNTFAFGHLSANTNILAKKALEMY